MRSFTRSIIDLFIEKKRVHKPSYARFSVAPMELKLDFGGPNEFDWFQI